MLAATAIKFLLQPMTKMKSCWEDIQRGGNIDRIDDTHMFRWSLSTKT